MLFHFIEINDSSPKFFDNLTHSQLQPAQKPTNLKYSEKTLPIKDKVTFEEYPSQTTS
jgi:hypothetical protein